MYIKLNNEIIEIPSSITTLGQLLELKQIATGGTAVALNGRLVERKLLDMTELNENDDVIIITAAFGG